MSLSATILFLSGLLAAQGFPLESNGVLTPEEGLKVINQAQEVIFTGLLAIKANIEKLPAESPRPAEEEWQKLNRTMEEYLKEQYQTIQVDATKSQLLQNITDAFLNYTGDFVNAIKEKNLKEKQAPKPPGFPQNIIQLFTGGAQQVASDVTGLDPASAATTKPPNFFANILANFNGGAKPETSSTAPNSSSQSTPGGFFGQIVNNFRPSSTPSSSSSSVAVGNEQDTVSTTTARGNLLQNFSNLFRQSTTTAAPASPSGFIQNAIQNANPFKASTETAPLADASGGGLMKNTEMLMCVNVGKFLNRT